MNLQKQKAFLIHFAYFSLIIGLAYISIKYVLPLMMPFVIGIVIAFLLRPAIDWIESKIHVKRSIIAIVILIVFYALIGFLISMFGVKVFTFLKDLFSKLPEFYQNTLAPGVDKAIKDLLIRYPNMKDNVEAIFGSMDLNKSISSFVEKASSTVVGTITGLAGQVPAFLIKFLFTIVASFFFTIDFHRISEFVIRQLPDTKRQFFLQIKDNGIGTLGKFFKAYALLILVTFSELSIGLLILGVPNSILVSAIIAVVDILPILGTGAVLLPWVAIAFFTGQNSFGIGMLILYVVITIVRQTLEPKIVGQQIGLHPVVTLLCMFVGAQLLGIIGLFLVPIVVTMLKKMNDEGTLHLFK